MTPAPDRRGLATALLLTALAALALLTSSAGPWVTGTLQRPAPLPDELLALPAAEVAPAVRAVGLVVLAAVPALLGARGRGRLVVGAVLLLCAVGAGWSAAAVLLDPTGAAPADARDVVATARPLLALAGVVATVVSGALVLAAGRRWPALGRRYEAPEPQAAGEAAAPRGELDDARVWEALDRGQDPTTDGPPDPPER